MHFVRSVPKRTYRNYRSYRALLRADFRYRCAYCLTQEYFLGGESGFAIDHYCPRNGDYARPDLENEYTNLYWTCGECNQNKADIYPSPAEEAQGYAWLDPCEPDGDHDLHWRVSPDGAIAWLTPAGEYTIKRLMLHRRDWLKRHWRKLHEWQQMRDTLVSLLATREMADDVREAVTAQLAALGDLLEPPVFHRPRRTQG